MASWPLLDQAEEDTLHKSRLLNVEEKPFKRITKRLFAPNSLILLRPTLPLTPPSDSTAADEAAAAHEAKKQQELNFRRQWREDVLLDFTAFDSSIARIQSLLTSNIKERERYAEEKVKIQASAQAVRDNTSELRIELDRAQRRLALRKEYDGLAEKILGNRLLRPREDQHANLQKLNAEIGDLETESQQYAKIWTERSNQFLKIIEQGMQLKRLIRDEKEEVERREGMEEEDGEDGESGSHMGGRSGIGTPRLDGEGLTPMQVVADREADSPGSHLKVDTGNTTRDRSPLRSTGGATEYEESHLPGIEIETLNTEEDGEVMSAESDKVADPLGGAVTDEGKEEGEEDEPEEAVTEGPAKVDNMDTS
ncbi:MAG: hypothetical protein Q9167_004330 [Letrouitia subvulpina]